MNWQFSDVARKESYIDGRLGIVRPEPINRSKRQISTTAIVLAAHQQPSYDIFLRIAIPVVAESCAIVPIIVHMRLDYVIVEQPARTISLHPWIDIRQVKGMSQFMRHSYKISAGRHERTAR